MVLHKIPNLNTQNAKAAPIGFSGDQVFLIEEGYQSKDVVVKISDYFDVIEEAKNFEWLQQYTKVPKIYATGCIEKKYYIVMEKLPGVMFQEVFATMPLHEIVVQYACLLKQFHQIDYRGIPYNHDLQYKLKVVKENIKTNKVRPQYFERELQQMDSQSMYHKMLEYKREEELVLCHGDFCFPNIIIDNGELSGYVDIMGLGVCDRYLDVAIAMRSLRYNFELYGHVFTEQYQTLFLNTYGIEKIDMDKVIFYILLDELTYR